VVSNNLEGHSGLVIQTVSSSDPDYQAIYVRDISASVADNDEAGIVVSLLGGALRVFEESTMGTALIVYQYMVVLTRAPEENVLVTAAPIPLRESEQRAGGKGIALNGSENGITLVFTRSNWFIPQTVSVTAPDDLLAEGARNLPIQHSVVQGVSPKDGGAYDGLAILGVPVMVIDNDTADVLIVPFDEGDEALEADNPLPDTFDTVVAEDPDAPLDIQDDIYMIVLTKKPTGLVTINLEVVGNDIKIVDSSSGSDVLVSILSIDFDDTDWNSPKPIRVRAVND
jgi:hypothetical protein